MHGNRIAEKEAGYRAVWTSHPDHVAVNDGVASQQLIRKPRTRGDDRQCFMLFIAEVINSLTGSAWVRDDAIGLDSDNAAVRASIALTNGEEWSLLHKCLIENERRPLLACLQQRPPPRRWR